MTAADDVRREYVERHKAGEHSWQPGPLVKVFDKPDDIILVCACGEVARRSIPARALLDERDAIEAARLRNAHDAWNAWRRVAALEEGLLEACRAECGPWFDEGSEKGKLDPAELADRIIARALLPDSRELSHDD